ncbi:unnamed protein product [Paramecium sonneborni]|uniref:WD40-repeat-containing domain n=1 Tax=Paramecium sonneborni TaxID=65129 RepID=A0A8S1RUN0_9CILI|nr:unnamed protein product [Paramecium sonneborni]
MFKSKMIENEKTLQCALKHQLPIVQVILNPQISKEQRLLCNECLDSVDIEGKAVGFKKIIQMMEEQQNEKINLIESIIIQNIQQIELFQSLISQMKSNVILQLEQLNTILKDWIINLQSIGLKYSQYSFYEELEIIINSCNNMRFNPTSFIKDINREYNNWNSKATSKLESYNQFPEYSKCKQIISDLQIDISKYRQFQNLDDNSINKKIELQNQIQIQQSISLQEEDVKLNLIDQSIKQVDYCVSIAFNSFGTIMVSTEEKVIKVWSFKNGKMQLLQSLEQHNGWVNCLIYSRIQDAFLSCSSDKTIRIWKLKKENQWISSQIYQQHTDKVCCMILNQNEDQLFSGGKDNSIKVWQLDLNNDKMTYLYSLNQHKKEVFALSLNQSENLLVSCGNGENEIIIWKRGIQNKMEFKSIVKQSINCQGWKVKFLKENQFIWVSKRKDIDKIFVFELKDSVFQENQEKTIQLNSNDQSDMDQFPIIQNKQRNEIIVRHKSYIYIIREMMNSKFKIVEQLKFNTNDIFGAITNNGSFLVCWDKANQAYSTYELLYK